MPGRSDVLRGTLDLMILQTLELSPMHGYGISRRLEQLTQGEVGVSPGSLFPALYRLEHHGWVRGKWGASDNGRRARYYALTAAGRRALSSEQTSWERLSQAVNLIMRMTPG